MPSPFKPICNECILGIQHCIEEQQLKDLEKIQAAANAKLLQMLLITMSEKI